MPVRNPEKFLAVLKQSRLFTPSQVAQAREFMQRPEQPSVLKVAQWLVKRRWATVWQAERLLAGNRTFFMGNYKFLEPIGEGAMGVVFKCEHALMERTVAVKVLSKARLSHPNALARFRREVQAVAALNHPNIVTAFDAGQAGATHYLVMEYIDGADLNGWMEEYDRISVPWACEFIRQAALGLHHAHQAALVHRDIKPANILVAWHDDEQRPIVKILDLGLARALNTRQEEFEPGADETAFTLRDEASSQLTHEGVILGTPDYLAPEQILRNEDVDARADIFSLGCTLFKVITAQLPYSGPNLMGKLQARVDPNAPPAVKLRTYLPDADPRLELVIAKMLRRDPNQRYQSAAEVAEVLAPFAKPPTEKWDPLQLLRAAESDSSEVGSSQMEFDPRLRDFLGALEDETGAAAGVTHSQETLPADAASQTSTASDSSGALRATRRSMAEAARHRRQRHRAPVLIAVLGALTAITLVVMWRMSVFSTSPNAPPPFVWPQASGLVAAWRSGWKESRVEGPGKQPEAPYRLKPHGDVGRGEHGELLFAGGWMEVAGVDKDLLAACQRTNQFTLEFTLASTVVRTERSEPIVAVGTNPRALDFSLAQDGDRLICQLRTSKTGKKAAPPKIDLSWFGAGFWRHLVISYRPGEFAFYLDGHMMKQLTDVRGNLSVWTAQPLALAHKGPGKRSWHGEIERIGVFNRFFDEDEAQRRYESFRDSMPHKRR